MMVRMDQKWCDFDPIALLCSLPFVSEEEMFQNGRRCLECFRLAVKPPALSFVFERFVRVEIRQKTYIFILDYQSTTYLPEVQ
ncbi:hypothetical protein CEXT_333531 [Caerostris extrusa]|uniref:Uncharacterized protein n=1 Tax=Caerostris extrusa TaxID=172846 RepID=A0AAV4RWI0_CAEEX|nr:hypothetical protein CEXT_333531 [Caerostris extrusa]